MLRKGYFCSVKYIFGVHSSLTTPGEQPGEIHASDSFRGESRTDSERVVC